MNLYKESTSPFSYSITPEIYRFIPNPTDFTVFLENNFTGINISVLDGLENYHTPNDKPESLSDKSMQHYGDQVLPMVTEFEEVDAPLFVKEDDNWQPDKLLDDQALIINTELGLVIVLGCAHRGIINTLYHAQWLTGVKQVHTVVGGSHLASASEERVWLTIAALRELGVQRLGLCHCTGLPVASLLAQEFGDSFFFNNTGTSFNLP